MKSNYLLRRFRFKKVIKYLTHFPLQLLNNLFECPIPCQLYGRSVKNKILLDDELFIVDNCSISIGRKVTATLIVLVVIT